jgi:DNA polymerase-3 subunit delta
MPMKFDQIVADLNNKIYRPVYFLFGEEPYFIDYICDYIEENVLNEAEKEFDQTVVYGRDVDTGTIIDTARRYPMMSSYMVVIVREAQDIDNIEKLQAYIDGPLKSTILVLAYKYKKIDKRKTFAKSIDKAGVLFESAKLYDNQIPSWITAQIKNRGFQISAKACTMLAEYLGTDLGRIMNEIEKLVINIPEGGTVTEEIIERNIGISKDYNIFELQDALGKKDILKANRIISHFASNPRQHPTVVVLTVLFNFFIKLMIFHQLKDRSRNNVASALSVNPFFVKDYSEAAGNYGMRKLRDIIALIRQYDLKVKGVNNATTEDGQLLKELIYKVLH